MAVLPTPTRTPGRRRQEPPHWPESCFHPVRHQRPELGEGVDVAPAPGLGLTGAPRAGTPGEGRVSGALCWKGPAPTSAGSAREGSCQC